MALPQDPTSPEFIEAYKRIHASFETHDASPSIMPGSIEHLIASFKKSSEFSELSAGAKGIYTHHLDLIVEKFGKFTAAALTRRVALEWRDSFSATPAMANNLVAAIKRIYSFGVDRGMVKHNPVVNIKKLRIGEWRPWTIEEIEIFQASASNQMRLALMLALYTGQRLSDVIKMRWNQIAEGGIDVVQKKTGQRVWIPLHKNLAEALAATKLSKTANDKKREGEKKTKLPDTITILSSPTGLPYKADHLKHKFKEAIRAANLPDDLVFHGLRKTAAVMLAEAGCTTEQIKSITGHRTDEMAAFYTKQANQKQMARAAIRKFENKNVQPLKAKLYNR